MNRETGPLSRLKSLFRRQSGPNSEERRASDIDVSPPSEPPVSALEHLALIFEDVQAVLDNDPAARHALEVVLAYPGLHALWLHRVAHGLWTRGMITTPRLIAHLNRMVTGIEIHPGAQLGRRVFIDHGMGIVIGETARVGDDCLLYKGVVLGGTSLERAERHPTLGRGVVVGTNACVLGPIHVGDGAKVGANSVVVRDVPGGCIVVGVPARLAGGRKKAPIRLDHANLPDPVSSALQAVVEELEGMRERLAAVEANAGKLRGRDHEHDDFEE